MATTIQTHLVSVRRCAGLLGINYHYLQAIIRNTPEITIRRIGACNAINYNQVRRILKTKGVKFGPELRNFSVKNKDRTESSGQ